MKAKKTILLFVDWYLPGYKAGGPIRSCANLVAHLKDEFEFRIVCRDTDYTETAPYSDIQPDEWIERSPGELVYYISNEKVNLKTFRTIIEDTSFDFAYINGVYSPWFSILPTWLLRRNKNVVIAARGMLAKSAIRVKGKKKKFFLSLMKMSGAYRNAIFHATNPQEAKDIKEALGVKTKVIVAPNLPVKLHAGPAEIVQKQEGVLELVSVARIAPEKNLLFALNVLSKVQTQGKIDFHVYGPVYDENYWLQCGKVAASLPVNIRFFYHGSLPHEKLHEVLGKHHYLFMPTRGENFGHIILESLASGTPVVISDQTPWKELEKKGVGYDLPLNNESAFYELIQGLAEQSDEAYSKLCENAFTFAYKFMNDPEAIDQNRKLFTTDAGS